MEVGVWGQGAYDVRFEWGLAGARYVGRGGVVVIVDVLSFTTSVSIAVERGTAVYPAPWVDDRVAELARDIDAVAAVGRGQVTAQTPWSLSPAALRTAAAPQRLVLPSPNGSAIAAAADGMVLAACLRNAAAVAQWLTSERREQRAVTVVAAGERWPDGSLRPALEDLLGAGAVLRELARLDFGSESPEATSARAAFEATTSVADAVRRSGSGLELIGRGFGADVEVAVECGSSTVVPVLQDRAFRQV